MTVIRLLVPELRSMDVTYLGRQLPDYVVARFLVQWLECLIRTPQANGTVGAWLEDWIVLDIALQPLIRSSPLLVHSTRGPCGQPVNPNLTTLRGRKPVFGRREVGYRLLVPRLDFLLSVSTSKIMQVIQQLCRVICTVGFGD